jgi:hypothetical protein
MAAKVKSAASTLTYKEKKKVRRKGVHAKTKMSNSKLSKNYKKPYVGQGH